MKKRILILEPYYGGSHKNFLQGLQKHVDAEYRLLTLPARKWKMRMQLSAPWFAEQIEKLHTCDRFFDTLLCSTFVDVSVLRSLLAQVEGWNQQTKVLTYYHENQFAYPQQFAKFALHQFTNINLNTALLSDSIAFNSEYNRTSFFKGCKQTLKAASDMSFTGLLEKLLLKSCILYPGIELNQIDKMRWKQTTDVPVIVWNHRWEHDKNPEAFFQALMELDRRGVEFRLIILGQSFQKSPVCFAEGCEKLKQKILHIGFVDSYQEYIELLSRGDIVVSTSFHEFYGISIIEAVRAGCTPVLPDRLSYPELFDSRYLYKSTKLVEKLESEINKKTRLTREAAQNLTEKFSWSSLQQSYSEWL